MWRNQNGGFLSGRLTFRKGRKSAERKRYDRIQVKKIVWCRFQDGGYGGIPAFGGRKVANSSPINLRPFAGSNARIRLNIAQITISGQDMEFKLIAQRVNKIRRRELRSASFETGRIPIRQKQDASARHAYACDTNAAVSGLCCVKVCALARTTTMTSATITANCGVNSSKRRVFVTA